MHIPAQPSDATRERSDIIFINFKLYADEVFIARGHKIFPVIQYVYIHARKRGREESQKGVRSFQACKSVCRNIFSATGRLADTGLELAERDAFLGALPTPRNAGALGETIGRTNERKDNKGTK